jgi:hypothetical protein
LTPFRRASRRLHQLVYASQPFIRDSNVALRRGPSSVVRDLPDSLFDANETGASQSSVCALMDGSACPELREQMPAAHPTSGAQPMLAVLAELRPIQDETVTERGPHAAPA